MMARSSLERFVLAYAGFNLSQRIEPCGYILRVRANRNSALISVYKIAQRQNEALQLLSELVSDYLAPEMTLEEIENARKRLSGISRADC